LTVKDNDGVDPSHSLDGQGTAQIAVDGTAPSAPTNLSSALVTKGVKLTWSSASDSGGSGVATYYVYRNGAKIGATTSLSYTDSTGTSGTTYTYTVTSVDGVGYESGNSNSTTITTKSSKGGKPR
jgi:chitodextrinase